MESSEMRMYWFAKHKQYSLYHFHVNVKEAAVFWHEDKRKYSISSKEAAV